MDDPETDRDEAFRRLGGPSRIAKLEATVYALAGHVNGLQIDIARLCIRVGATVDPNLTGLVWRNEDGAVAQGPLDVCHIEGLGKDWCALRSEMGALYFASCPGWDIRDQLAPGTDGPDAPPAALTKLLLDEQP